MRSGILAAISAAAALAIFGCHAQVPTLSLLVWEGYADPSFVHEFEESHHCKVSAAYMGSSDELVAKLRGGSASNYDVISPSSDVATMIATSGLAAPLDVAKLPAYQQLSSRLRRALHLGTQSAALRYDGVRQAAGKLGGAVGSKI
jgi:putative spermidine/putrescine transport system substrate-binding protein/spermidine/putrescine transport system substrate-binding protein